MVARLQKSFRSHVPSASHSEFSEPLNKVFDQLSFFLLGEKESVHVDICFFLEEAAKGKELPGHPSM